ncbi:tyrosine-type recombinase/integrase [Methylocystis sp. H62]|uniref:tyrosine-type recombinase/integrase n=1 Tax=Methylocystis sp. H62 TaxID=2785789 RepID=UPI0018C2560B|nr:tyrosine-type recombinase/integrase [Methylocystis sp. H62]MBG0792519.1 tyrosine-type recombinase/integrase [Methylocystis sp. H62]
MANTDDEREGGDPSLIERAPTPHLAALSEKARDYARNARADNTQRAYESDWRQFAAWLRRQGFDPLPPHPQTVGLYLAACMDGAVSAGGRAPLSVATLERRLAGICWHYRQRGEPLDTSDRHISTVLAGIRRAHGRPPLQKEAIFADELLAMLATLDMDLRGIRDRAILAIGFAGGLRRSEIVGLDCGPDQSEDGTGWIEIFGRAKNSNSAENAHGASPFDNDSTDNAKGSSEGGLLLTLNGKTGWREVEIGRGSRPETCPVALLETWMRLGRINSGPLFRPIARKNGGVSAARLTDKHVARLVQKTALAAGIRGDLTEGERRRAFGGHSLRAGLASSAQIEEAHVQKHLGHASAEMTRRYQRKRDRFKVNLTKAAGL